MSVESSSIHPHPVFGSGSPGASILIEPERRFNDKLTQGPHSENVVQITGILENFPLKKGYLVRVLNLRTPNKELGFGLGGGAPR